jgi:AsmA family
MADEELKRRRKRRRLWMALGASVALLAGLIVPPMVSVNRYKSQIVQLISSSLGRPVHLSGVKLRLLPWPGFVLSNLVVDEDPAYGYEPVLHAATVTATFRLLPLWRGRLEIGRISVDEASLNLVRMANGQWNLDPLFRTANAKAGASAERSTHRKVPLPYLEATNSRIDFKEGVEKLPFSLVNADLSFWQEAPGDWHIRLRGQPARTDVSLFQEDTGVVRLEASLHSAPALREMPLHVDLEWSEAQLGQLSRLLIGSDPGWRGNLTAELHVSGTADTAHVTTRLRAAGVHRAEFAPAEPLDFDANCGFVYHYAHRSVEDLVCNSPLGNGHVRLAGDLPGGSERPHFSLALDQVPVEAALGFLRTIRSGIDPSLSAAGTVSGKMAYTGGAAEAAARTGRDGDSRRRRTPAKAQPEATTPLEGSFTVSGFQLSGDSLSQPVQAARITFDPEEISPGGPVALTGTANIPAGGTAPLTFTPLLSLHGYKLAIRGQASLAKAREFAQAAGAVNVAALDALTGGPVTVALNVEGPWLPPEEPIEEGPANAAETRADPLTAADRETALEDDPDAPLPAGDSLAGTVTIHDAGWKADYLAHRVVISEATLQLGDGQVRWDPVEFSYGPAKDPVRGTASVTPPGQCAPQPAGQACPAHFAVEFGKLDAAALESALLGTREPVSLLTALIDRLHLSSAPAWPELDGTVKAESLELGPVTLGDPTATLRILPSGARFESLDADVLGGKMHLTGTLTKPPTDAGQPVYALEGKFEGLSAEEVGRLLDMRWRGGPFDAEGRVKLAGLTERELAASAKGTVQFDWRQGVVSALPAAGGRGRDPGKTGRESAAERGETVPAVLSRFSRFGGDAEIGEGKATLRGAEAVEGRRRRPVNAEVIFGEPPTVKFAAPKEMAGERRQKGRPVE